LTDSPKPAENKPVGRNFSFLTLRKIPTWGSPIQEKKHEGTEYSLGNNRKRERLTVGRGEKRVGDWRGREKKGYRQANVFSPAVLHGRRHGGGEL